MVENRIQIKRVNLKEELEICKSIRQNVFTDEQNVPVEIDIDEYDVLGNNIVHFLIYFNSEAIGTSRIIKVSSKKVMLQRVAIKKAFRGKGYASKLLKFIEEYVKNEKIDYIELHAQYYVKKFYEKLGYEEISRKYIEKETGIEHIDMNKKLK